MGAQNDFASGTSRTFLFVPRPSCDILTYKHFKFLLCFLVSFYSVLFLIHANCLAYTMFSLLNDNRPILEIVFHHSGNLKK